MTSTVPDNPKSTYRALLLDYDALLAASDAECSYCLSQREVQMLLAFVDYISWKTRYIATETEIDRVLIAHWSANLARKLMSGCCGDEQLHRFTAEGVYQSSDDGGTTWFDDPANDPRNDGTASPPLPGDASDSKRCAAADNVRDLFEQYRDNLISIVGATPSIIAIVAGILAFIGTILGLSGVGVAIGVLFLSMAAEMIQIGGTGISGAITFTALQDFRCLVFCRMNNDGELTYDAWQLLLADIAGTFSGFAETFFYQTVNGMGYIGVSNAGTIGASTAADCECDCLCQFSVTFESGGWDVYDVAFGTVESDHLSIVAHTFPLGAGYGCEIEIDMLETCLVSTIPFDVELTNQRPGNSVSISWEFFDSSHVSVGSGGGDFSGVADGTPQHLNPTITPTSAQYVTLRVGWLDAGDPNSGFIDNIQINH